MKHIIRIVALLLSIIMLTGCAHNTITAHILTGDKITPLEVTAEAAWDFSPVGDLGARLLSCAVSQGEQNPVISPLSAYICLTMAMNGADADTLAAFEQVMGADMDYANLICRTLMSSFKNIGGGTELALACSAWCDDSAQIKEEFLRAIVTHMEADVFMADLSSKADIKAINNWVNSKTKGLIPTLHDDPYSEDTMLVLLNALYMNAKWQRPFEGWRTHQSAFTTAYGEEMLTDFMSMDGDLLYIDAEDAKGILLPYKDQRLAFIALLPERDLADYVSSLTGEKLFNAVQSASEEFAHLWLPKFDFEYDRSMTEDLSVLGLEIAFDPDKANFIPMGSGPNGELYLSEVYQKVKIIVDEEGTEAAAVTEAAAAEGAAMIEPTEIYFDRPFLYAVVETATGMPLFLGTYDMPIE